MKGGEKMKQSLSDVIGGMIAEIMAGDARTLLRESGDLKLRVYRMYDYMIRIEIVSISHTPLRNLQWKKLLKKGGKDEINRGH